MNLLTAAGVLALIMAAALQWAELRHARRQDATIRRLLAALGEARSRISGHLCVDHGR